MRGFKVPNSLLRSGLKHTPLFVCLYLLSLRRRGHNDVDITVGQIADRLHISPRAVSSALAALVRTGLVQRGYVYRYGRPVALRLTLPAIIGRWVWVESRVFDLNLMASEMTVYLYLKSRANHVGRSYPSLSKIQAETGLSKNTILRAMRSLTAMVLLHKVHAPKEDNSLGNNHYTTITCEQRDQLMVLLRKRKARTTGKWYRPQRKTLLCSEYHVVVDNAIHGRETRDILTI